MNGGAGVRGARYLPAMRVASGWLLFAGLLPSVAKGQVLTPREALDSSRAALVRDVGRLASAEFAGRATGTAGADSTIAYLARAYVAMQVDPAGRGPCDDSGRCTRSYRQTFALPRWTLRNTGLDSTALATNVIAAIPGTDEVLAQEWIVLGAHHDHLGATGIGARDARTARLPHLGADDNASGTAALLELARRLASAPVRRSILLVHFGAEELGLLGSTAFLTDPPVPVRAMVAMINLDMVGRLGGKRLTVFGTATSPAWSTQLDAAAREAEVRLDPSADLGVRGTGSDHIEFARLGLPSLHLFTGVHEAYHTKDDTPAKVDYDGLVRVVVFTESLVRALGDAPVALPRSATP